MDICRTLINDISIFRYSRTTSTTPIGIVNTPNSKSLKAKFSRKKLKGVWSFCNGSLMMAMATDIFPNVAMIDRTAMITAVNNDNSEGAGVMAVLNAWQIIDAV